MSQPTNKVIVLDIETTGLNPRKDKLHGIGVAWKSDQIVYHTDDYSWVRRALASSDYHVVGHNIRFDAKFLIEKGFHIKAKLWDTKVLAQLLDENQKLGLKDLADKHIGVGSLEDKRELDRAISKEGLRHVGELCAVDLADPNRPYTDLIGRYCKEDCQNTLTLWETLTKQLRVVHDKMIKLGFKKTPLDYYHEEAMPIERLLVGMELRGIKVDVPAVKRFRAKLVSENEILYTSMHNKCLKQIGEVEDDLYECAISKRKSDKGKENVEKQSEKYKTKFNWQSSDHVAALIFNKFGVPTSVVDKTSTGRPSTSESSLAQLRKDLPDSTALKDALSFYAAWKKNIKLLTTYTGEKKGLLSKVEDSRVYADYLQAGRGKQGTLGGTVTGRLSSRNPNMQNLPRGSEVKTFFVPDDNEHVFLYFDYSQLELRLAAHLSQDPVMLKAYREDLDLHQLTADGAGVPRQTGKTVNFLTIYDGSAWRLSQVLDQSVEQCQNIIDSFFSLYHVYRSYLNMQKQYMCKNGLVVSQAGRVRRLPDVKFQNWKSKEWKHALKQGYNFPIQSLGATITKHTMVALAKAGYNLVTQVHDSVIIQLHKSADIQKEIATVKQIAEQIQPLSVPLKVDIKLLTSLSESASLTIEENNICQNKIKINQ
jgi:DNA polymerase-1